MQFTVFPNTLISRSARQQVSEDNKLSLGVGKCALQTSATVESAAMPISHPYSQLPKMTDSSGLPADTLFFLFTNSFQLGQPQQTLSIPIF